LPRFLKKRTQLNVEQGDVSAISPITHLSACGVLLCIPCKSAIPLDKLKNHLFYSHKCLKTCIRRAIVSEFQGLLVARTAEDLQPCADGSPPLDYLRPPVAGFYCPQCPSYRTICWHSLRQHLNKAHQSRFALLRSEEVSCYLQKWTHRSGPASGRYWKVDMSVLPSTSRSNDYTGPQLAY